jgi:hypothetical protein
VASSLTGRISSSISFDSSLGARADHLCQNVEASGAYRQVRDRPAAGDSVSKVVDPCAAVYRDAQPGHGPESKAVRIDERHDAYGATAPEPARVLPDQPFRHAQASGYLLIRDPSVGIDPPVRFLNEFAGVAITSARDARAVGSSDRGARLIEHWNGKPGSRTH